MEESMCAKKCLKKRFDVNLNATYSIRGHDMQQQECRIANLSSSGAAVSFPHTESLRKGAVIAMDINTPDTTLRIATEAEIVWTRQHFNGLISGIKFTEMLSDAVIQDVVTKVPQLSKYTEVIW